MKDRAVEQSSSRAVEEKGEEGRGVAWRGVRFELSTR